MLTAVLLAPPSARVQLPADTGGVVVDSAGRPVSGAVVAVSGTRLSLTTDFTGRFRFRGLPPGPLSLRVRAIGYLPLLHQMDLAKAAAGLDTVRLQLAPTLLQPLEARGVLEPPRFRLDTLKALGGPSRFPLADGASLAVNGLNGLALVRFRIGSVIVASRSEYSTALSENPAGEIPGGTLIAPPLSGGGGSSSFGSWEACFNVRVPVLATFADSTTRRLTLLTQRGAVWARLLHDSFQPPPCQLAQQFEPGSRGESAVGDARGWVVTTRERSGAVVTRWRHTTRREFQVDADRLFGDPGGPADLPAVFALAGRTTVARRHWPFGWVELDSSGAVRVRSDSALTQILTAGGADDTLTGWHAYPALPIERGYIQTLESRDRSARRYLLFDLLGRLVGSPGHAWMPVLIASSSGGRQLIGLRYLNWQGTTAAPWALRY
ncbi:MAG TPA: carboxypeptidase-like regulatory domain-containing protein [Gemmatimonadales bacterium]|nr:carboxypeptidase-like regulatory domain-containing protein [Gemmatimonadales bacterium]